MELTDTTSLIEEKMDIVTFLIKVDGKEISREYHITEIIVQLGINKIPSANITIIDGEPSKGDFEISTSNEFLPDKKILIELEYKPKKEKTVNGRNTDDKLVFNGIIITVTHRVNNNCAELTLVCKDETEKMTITKSNAHFKKQITASEIAEELLQKKDIKTSIEMNSLRHEQVVQSNISDWDFMIGRLEVAGMMCLIQNGEATIKKLENKPLENSLADMLKLVYGRNILEFNAEKDSRIQSDSVKTFSWDYKKQEVMTTGNDETDSEEEGNGSQKVSPEYEMRTSANLTEEERKSLSNTKKLKQELSKIKGKVKYLGTTTASPGDFIELTGVGEKFSGKAFVSALQHEYNDGCWMTEATLGWNEQFFSEEINPHHSASDTGQPSALQGLQIGIVTSIIDNDGEYRVQVRLPLVDNKADGLHARIATLDAGNKRGSFFRPEIDDEVVIGFLNDDPSNPVILGMLHSSAKPSPLEPEKNNDKKGYVSRSEIKLIFDDGETSVKIETPGSRVFELNDNTGTITLKDGDGNKIVMEQSGITMEASKDITIKAGSSLSLAASKISIKADASLEAEGSSATNLKSGGVTEIKGSLVKIN